MASTTETRDAAYATDHAGGLCPVCGDGVPAEPCGNCGWERGLIVACQKDMGETVEVGFAAEQRHKMMLWSGLLSCGLGVVPPGMSTLE